MASTAVTFLSKIIGFLSVTDTYIHTYIQTISEMRRRISCLALRHSANTETRLNKILRHVLQSGQRSPEPVTVYSSTTYGILSYST